MKKSCHILVYDEQSLPAVRRDKRQQCQVTGALDRNSQATLVAGAGAATAARNDLAALGHKALEPLDILVVGRADFVNTVDANLAPGNELAAVVAALTTFAALATIATVSSIAHNAYFLYDVRQRRELFERMYASWGTILRW